MATMDPTATPPSPAPSNREVLPSGFDALAQYNAENPTPAATTSHPRDPESQVQRQPTMDEIHAAASQPVSRYGTPAPVLPQLPAQPYYDPAATQYQDPSLAVSQYPYPPENTSLYSMEGLPQMNQDTPAYNTPGASPQIPDGLTLRSGPVTRSGGASAGSKALGVQGVVKIQKTPTRKKKAKTEEEERAAALAAAEEIQMDKPLSEMDSTVPLVDIEAWVNRSAEERRRQAVEHKLPGKVTRPMNSFMLYRKAYQHRAKAWSSHNNHQVVSRVCGASWGIEPQHIKDKYEALSREERVNHTNAHPEYKFAPAKTKKTKNASESPEDDYAPAAMMRSRQMARDDDSDLPHWGWDTESRMTSRTHTPMDDSDGEWRPSGSLRQQYAGGRMGMAPPQYHHQVRSTFAYNNPGKPLPAAYNNAELEHGQYYQQSTVTRPGFIEDVSIHKTSSPGMVGGPVYHSPQHPNNVALGLMHASNHNLYPSMTPRSVDMQPGQEHHGMMMSHGAYDQQAYLPQPQQQPQQPQHQQQAPAELLDPAIFGMPELGSEEATAAGMVGASAGGDAFLGYSEEQQLMIQGTGDEWQVNELDPAMGLDDDSWNHLATSAAEA